MARADLAKDLEVVRLVKLLRFFEAAIEALLPKSKAEELRDSTRLKSVDLETLRLENSPGKGHAPLLVEDEAKQIQFDD